MKTGLKKSLSRLYFSLIFVFICSFFFVKILEPGDVKTKEEPTSFSKVILVQK